MNKNMILLTCLLSGFSFVWLNGMEKRVEFRTAAPGEALLPAVLAKNAALIIKQNIVELSEDNVTFDAFLQALETQLKSYRVLINETFMLNGRGSSMTLLHYCDANLRGMVHDDAEKVRRLDLVIKMLDTHGTRIAKDGKKSDAFDAGALANPLQNFGKRSSDDLGVSDSRSGVTSGLAPSAARSRATTLKSLDDDSDDEASRLPRGRGPRSRKPLFFGLAAVAGMGLLFWKWYTTEEKKA